MVTNHHMLCQNMLQNKQMTESLSVISVVGLSQAKQRTSVMTFRRHTRTSRTLYYQVQL